MLCKVMHRKWFAWPIYTRPHASSVVKWMGDKGSYFMQGRQCQVAGQKSSINFACWGHTLRTGRVPSCRFSPLRMKRAWERDLFPRFYYFFKHHSVLEYTEFAWVKLTCYSSDRQLGGAWEQAPTNKINAIPFWPATWLLFPDEVAHLPFT